jgi:hypothetical protein
MGGLIKILLDTSVYIPYINQGIAHPILEFREGAPVLYMSAVVMEELYAGAFDRTTQRLLDRVYRTFNKLGRMVTPDAGDWQRAGRIIASLGQKYGFEERYLSRVLNDTLIALSSRKIGATLFTKNRKDYLRIKEFVDFAIAPWRESLQRGIKACRRHP